MKIEKVTISTNDLNAIKNFYSNKLGYSILTDSDYKISVMVGTTLLEIEQVQEKLTGHYHMAFEVYKGQLDRLYEELKQSLDFINRGETIIFDIKNWKSRAIYFYDSDFNILEFIERNFAEEMKNNNPIRSIIEVGLGLTNMKQLEELKYQTELKTFPGILSDEFQPIGEFDGLFICVPNGRIWNPSNRRVGINPKVVEFNVSGKHKKLIYNSKGEITVENIEP